MSRNSILNIAWWRIATLLFFIQANIYSPVQSQTTSFNFRRLTNSEGLSDGVVHGYVRRARLAGLRWPLPEGDDEGLVLLLFRRRR